MGHSSDRILQAVKDMRVRSVKLEDPEVGVSHTCCFAVSLLVQRLITVLPSLEGYRTLDVVLACKPSKFYELNKTPHVQQVSIFRGKGSGASKALRF